jgi:hypothetical protein
MNDFGNDISNNRLAQLAAEARAAHEEVCQSHHNAAQRAVDAGRALFEARGGKLNAEGRIIEAGDADYSVDVIPRGEWERWVEQETGVPHRTANLYISLFRAVAEQRVTVPVIAKEGQKAALKIGAAADSERRREASLGAVALVDGMDLRIGDCRVVLSDIADNSVPLILTDPPYGIVSEGLYEWLAQFAARVLVPGGSLICYTGQGTLPRDYHILGKHLKYNWTPIMLHNAAQKLFAAGVVAYHKPILWYVKDFRRPDANGRRTLIPDVVHDSKRDKSTHDWAQGDGGVRRWIHQLTEPGETIVDPFCGTAEWGRITCQEGRRWIGADIALGGTETVMAGEMEEPDV